jgi:hypothetical protein
MKLHIYWNFYFYFPNFVMFGHVVERKRIYGNDITIESVFWCTLQIQSFVCLRVEHCHLFCSWSASLIVLPLTNDCSLHTINRIYGHFVFAQICSSATVHIQYRSHTPSLAMFPILHYREPCFYKDRVGGVHLNSESHGSPTLSSFQLSVPLSWTRWIPLQLIPLQ